MTDQQPLDPLRQVCPVCDAPLGADEQACARCGADLTALRLVLSFSTYHANQALRLARVGEGTSAIDHAHAAAALDPGNVGALHLLARLYARSGRHDQALEAWSRVLALDPDHQGAQAGSARARELRGAKPLVRRSRALLAVGAMGSLALVVGILAGTALRQATQPEASEPRQVKVPPTSFPATASPSSPVQQAQTPSAEVPSAAPDLAALALARLSADPRFDVYPLEVVQLGTGLRVSGQLASHGDRTALEKLLLAIDGVSLLDTSGIDVAGDPAVPTPARRAKHLVVPGDTLAELAELYCGTAHLWPRLYEANNDILTNPDTIVPGMQLEVPEDCP